MTKWQIVKEAYKAGRWPLAKNEKELEAIVKKVESKEPFENKKEKAVWGYFVSAPDVRMYQIAKLNGLECQPVSQMVRALANQDKTFKEIYNLKSAVAKKTSIKTKLNEKTEGKLKLEDLI